MSQKIIDFKFNRRRFLKQAGLLGGALIAFPNLIVRPAYAGTTFIIDSSGDKRIELTNGSFAREIAVGSWTTLRLCMRCNFIASATIPNSPLLYAGFCSGSANQILDATTTNFVGSRLGGGSVDFAFVNDTVDYIHTSSQSNSVKRIGSTITTGGGHGSLAYSCEAGTSNLLFVQLAANTVQLLAGTTVSHVQSNRSRSDFLAQAILATPNMGTWGSAQALTYDQSAGTLDHINIGWNRFEATFQITDLAVVKMA
jgi:hypothetical protein